jgi:hypothetical protein
MESEKGLLEEENLLLSAELAEQIGQEKAIFLTLLTEKSINCIIHGDLDELDFCKLYFDEVAKLKNDTLENQKAKMRWFDENGYIELKDTTDKYWLFKILMPWETSSKNQFNTFDSVELFL